MHHALILVRRTLRWTKQTISWSHRSFRDYNHKDRPKVKRTCQVLLSSMPRTNFGEGGKEWEEPCLGGCDGQRRRPRWQEGGDLQAEFWFSALMLWLGGNPPGNLVKNADSDSKGWMGLRLYISDNFQECWCALLWARPNFEEHGSKCQRRKSQPHLGGWSHLLVRWELSRQEIEDGKAREH